MGLKKIPALFGIQSYLGSLFSSLPLTPNQITLSAVLFAAIGFLFSLQQLPLFSLAFFALSGLADALDGAIARAKGMVSAKGAYIDGMADRLVEFLLVMSFFFYSLPSFVLPAQYLLMLILFFGSAMTSFATAYADHRKVAGSKKLAAQPGILPRTERLLLLFLALALVPFQPGLTSLILFAGAALCIVTFAQRFAYFAG